MSTRRSTWTEQRVRIGRRRYLSRPHKRLRRTRYLVAATACGLAAVLIPSVLAPALLGSEGPARGGLNTGMFVVPSAAGGSDRQAYLYFPSEWPRTLALDSLGEVAGQSPDRSSGGAGGHGGGMDVAPMILDIKQYRVRRGDTMSGIAHRFGLSLDTVASLNRTAGMGVHRLDIGELIRVPNQDGIYLTVNDLDETCRDRGVLPERAADQRITREQLTPSMELFFRVSSTPGGS